ncbi:hypothetical protein SOVF_115850 [Spinacia oleracea]|nr:hypothetical protein SOVF_115850 [Spinacia oleracea]
MPQSSIYINALLVEEETTLQEEGRWVKVVVHLSLSRTLMR